MKIKWRKLNNIIHRDFGYFFFGMTVIYALSGIAINHLKDWNPNYVIKTYEQQLPPQTKLVNMDKEDVLALLTQLDLDKNDYKKHYYPSSGQSLKIFIKGGTIYVDLFSKNASVETIKKRPIFNQVNFLHYNPNTWWTWFSDIYAVALLLLAVTGLFVLRGKNGIKGRGAWLTTIGVLIPILFLIFFK